VTIVVIRNSLTQNFAKLLRFLFQDSLENKRKKKAMGHPTKKMEVNLIIDLTGKLLRTNEELQKKKEGNNGCKMKKTGDKDFCKKLRSVELLRKPEEKKKRRTLKQELNQRDKEEKKKLKWKNKDGKRREDNLKNLKKNEDRKKKLECRLKKRKDNRDMNKLAKLLLSYKIELLKLLLLIFKRKCWLITDLLTVLTSSNNLTEITMVILLLVNSKTISPKTRT
jgi:hypothetical protein